MRIKPFGLLVPVVKGGDFIQYGLYNEAAFDELVYNQNYIPIATVDELKILDSVVPETMGVGTKYEGVYTVGLDKKYVQYIPLDLAAYSVPTYVGIFDGIFDGNETTISNIAINTFANNYGTFENCIFSGEINTTGIYHGGIVAQNHGTINNCTWIGDITADDLIGGITATNSGGTITNCVSAGTLTCDSIVGGIIASSTLGTISACNTSCIISCIGNYAGGFVGSNVSTPISNCYSTGSVTGSQYIGGFCGKHEVAGLIENCYSTGSIIGTSERIGGFVGWNVGTINNCYATGNVTNTFQSGNGFSTGGFVGANYTNAATINNCYATGNVVSAGQYVGGFGGFCPDPINNCYSIGSVSGLAPIGGFCGNASTVSNSYWDTVTSGMATSSGGTGKTTTEMQTGTIPDVAIYIGWSGLIWNAVNNTSYPVLL